MSAFSHKKFDAGQYNQFRPQYPRSLFDEILKYHLATEGNQLGTLLDVGCGTGQVFVPLAPEFKKVIATDVSSVMVDKSKKAAEHITTPTEVYVASAEDLPLDNSSVDLVLGGECAHWMDTARWFAEVDRILQPNGTFAYFGYVDPIFVGEPVANEVYDEITYENGEFLGPHWQQPGRTRMRTLFREINDQLIKDPRFDNVVVVYNDPSRPETQPAAPKFELTKKLTLEEYLNYGKTWSTYTNWKSKHTGQDTRDPLDVMYERLNRRLGWEKQTTIEISWKTVYVMARKIGRK